MTRLEYDHTKPHGVMPPTTGGKRDGYAAKPTPDPRPKQYLGVDGEGQFEVTAMHYRPDNKKAVRAWLKGHRRPAFFEYGRWIVVHEKEVNSFADWEFKELFKPAVMCGYEGE